MTKRTRPRRRHKNKFNCLTFISAGCPALGNGFVSFQPQSQSVRRSEWKKDNDDDWLKKIIMANLSQLH